MLALAMLLALVPARADDLAADLGGGFQAAVPAQQSEALQVDMTTADVIIGYIRAWWTWTRT